MTRTIQLKRLTRSEDFRRVRAGRRHWAMPGVVVQAREMPAAVRAREDGDVARIGFTVSRRVGKAVVRNRAKRRLRAAAAEVMPGAAKPGMDYVLIGRQRTVDRPFAALKTDMETAVRRLDPERKEAEAS
jgi:ribonuclease P protein component